MDAAVIDEIARAAMKAAKAPAAAVAVVVGETVYTQGYGVREVGKADPVTPDTLFAIASATKAFTATAMALLVDAGAMAWDDPVRKHLPEFRLSDPLADAQVTLRDLLCHRTGMPRHDMLWFGSPWDRAEVLRRFGRAKPTASFRALYQYNNICFLAAGEAVARAAGAASYEAFVREHLFAPLGMTGANCSTGDMEKIADRATPYRREKNRLEAVPWRCLDNVGPCGSINAGVNDLARWVRFQLAGGVTPDGRRLLSEATLRETHTPQMVVRADESQRTLYPERVQTSYGLGWSIFDYRGGHRIVSHSGSIGGFRSQVALVPDAGIGIAALVNVPSHFPEMVRNTLIDHLLGLPARDWNRAFAKQLKKSEADQKARRKEKAEKRHRKTAPSRELAAYAGIYEEPAYGTATVTRKGQKLTLAWSSYTATLSHHHFDTFTTATDDPAFKDQEVMFALDAHGDIASLTLLDAVFQKAAPKKV